jgi:hypothetical protein
MMRIGYDFQDAYLGNAFSQGSVISRKNSNRQSFRMGIGLLRRMEEVFRRAESPDLEAIAMVDLYLADWMVMFDERDSASRYGIAFDNLREVGVPSQQLNRFFAVPQILPRTEFYPSVEEAMQAIEIANLPMVDAERSAEPEVRSDIRFEEWSPGFPNFPTQVLSATLLPEEIEDYETVHLSIRLRGLEKVSRWVSGRYISQISVPDQFEIIEPSQLYAMDLEELAFRMHFLTFRPRLVDGVAQPFEGTLSYRYFTDWNQ